MNCQKKKARNALSPTIPIRSHVLMHTWSHVVMQITKYTESEGVIVRFGVHFNEKIRTLRT